jgi:putative glutamine amidotransferase
MQSELVRVNSYHHQAVDQPGHEVQVVAWAPDDIVEGIELPDHPFALGVQWHPERIFWHDRTQFALFRALVRAGQTRERDDVRRET